MLLHINGGGSSHRVNRRPTFRMAPVRHVLRHALTYKRRGFLSPGEQPQDGEVERRAGVGVDAVVGLADDVALRPLPPVRPCQAPREVPRQLRRVVPAPFPVLRPARERAEPQSKILVNRPSKAVNPPSEAVN
eukprot:1148111-Prorocentrum_minimum.AAC.1